MSIKSRFLHFFAKCNETLPFFALNDRSESLCLMKMVFAKLDSRFGVGITTPNAINLFRFFVIFERNRLKKGKEPLARA